jgi:hypothetical protein
MPYKITGTGIGGIQLEYQKATRTAAIDLAVKMGSNGVDDARVFDRKGAEINLDDLAHPRLLNRIVSWLLARQRPCP